MGGQENSPGVWKPKWTAADNCRKKTGKKKRDAQTNKKEVKREKPEEKVDCDLSHVPSN